MSIEGILGRKLGMTQIFEKDGTAVPVTVIEAGPCTVVQVKTGERDGYQAVQVGFGVRKRVNSPQKGHMKGLGQFRYLREFQVDDIQAEYARLKDLGVQFAMEPTNMGMTTAAVFDDTCGNLIQIFQVTDG